MTTVPAVRLVVRRRVVAVALLALGGILVAAHVGLSLSHTGASGLDYTIREAIGAALFGAAAIACLVRAARRRQKRFAWAAIGGALAGSVIGTVIYSLTATDGITLSAVTISDAFFLAAYAGLIAGVVSLASGMRRRPGEGLDGIVAVLGLGTLWAWFVLEPVIRHNAEHAETGKTVTVTLAVSVLYPALDLVIVALVLGALARIAWRPTAAFVVLCAAALLLAGTDSIYTAQLNQHSYEVGGLIDSLWPVAALLAGIAAWAPDRQFSTPLRGPAIGIVVVTAFSAVAITALIFDHFSRLSDATVVLAGLTLVAAQVRLVVIYRGRTRAEHEARTGALQAAQALAIAVDAKDRYTHHHSERVAVYAVATAVRLGLDVEHAERIAIAGRLHDVGKIAVPDAILLKPDRLTAEEYEQVQRHSPAGEEIVQAIDPGLGRWIRHHHERWDGSGYPDGLAGDASPLESRILACADALDAMTTTRSYRPAKSLEQAAVELEAGAGTQFDPVVAGELIALLQTGVLRLRLEDDTFVTSYAITKAANGHLDEEAYRHLQQVLTNGFLPDATRITVTTSS